MPNDLETRQEAGVMDLVSGIITDVHVLVNQQLALFRHEIKGDIGHVQQAGSLLAAGLAIVILGGFLLCGMLVHLLAWMAPGLPLWGCYGIVGVPIAVLGGILSLAGMRRFKKFNIAAVEPAYDTKEIVDG